MIGGLRGKVVRCIGETVLLDVGGVCYEVAATRPLFERCLEQSSKTPNDEIFCLVLTDVKENSITLYGFSSLTERQVFLLLRKVKGIGSRIALNVLSALNPESILGAISSQDIKALQAVPGIGRKSAERVVVELREHVGALLTDSEGVGSLSSQIDKSNQGGRSAGGDSSRNVSRNSVTQDVVLALSKLGIDEARASTAVRRAIGESKLQLDSGELLRAALGNLE